MSSGIRLARADQHLISAGIKTARSSVQPRETEQRIELRRCFANLLADFAHRGKQHVDLDGLAGFDVLEHRSPEGTKLASDRVAILATLLDWTADSAAYCRGLAHHLETKTVDQGLVAHPVARRAGERRDRIHGHVSPQLVPDVALDAGGYLDIERGAGERLRNC